jgi:hypothetical protein
VNDEQAERMLALLTRIADDVSEMHSAFDEFRSYGATNATDLLDGITGPLGYNLGDLHGKLDDIQATLNLIDINTNSA